MSFYDYEKERQLRHFHFTAEQLYADFCDLTKSRIKENLTVLENMLIQKFPDEQQTIQDEMLKLNEYFVATTAESLEKFKLVVKDIFAIPEPEVVPTSSSEIEKLEKEVRDLELQCLKEQFYTENLQQKLKELESIQPIYNKVEEKLKFYKEKKLGIRKTFEEVNECMVKYIKEKYLQKSEGDLVDLF